MLNLTQEFTLLLLDERKGKIQAWTQRALPWAIPAALLDDLLLAGRLHEDAQGRVVVTGDQSLGDTLLDGVLQQFAQASEPHPLKYWIGFLSLRWEEYLDQSIQGLVNQGVLVSAQRRHTWSRPETVYTLSEARTRFWIVLRLRAVIFSAEPPDAQTNALLALLSECGLLGLIASKEELKKAYHLSGLLVESDAVSRGAGDLLRERSGTARSAPLAGRFQSPRY